MTRGTLERLWLGLREVWAHLRTHLGARGSVRREPIDDIEALSDFLASRASYVAQSCLYGYLRTRTGVRFPELFDDDVFVASINIAKWEVWLACLSDLAVYAGGLLARRTQAPAEAVHAVVRQAVEAVLAPAGVPDDAGASFARSRERVRERLGHCAWDAIGDDGGAFTSSPDALVSWAPVVDELKRLDEEIVRNSVRFRWNEVRRDLRSHLDAEKVMGAGAARG